MRFLVGVVAGSILALSVLNMSNMREELIDFGTSVKNNLQFPQSSVEIIEEAIEAVESPGFLDELQTASGSSTHPEEIIHAPENLRPEADSSSIEVEDRFQPAWIPFRSEVSARGFATKLQQQTETDYQVRKMGAGRYEVGFLYESDIERLSILHSIFVLTGFEPRPNSGDAKAVNPGLSQSETVQRSTAQR